MKQLVSFETIFSVFFEVKQFCKIFLAGAVFTAIFVVNLHAQPAATNPGLERLLM